MPHHWSGWPGAYCTRCGAEDAIENAMALGWYEPGTEHLLGGAWKSAEHEELCNLLNSKCPRDDILGVEFFKKIEELKKRIELVS